MIKFSVEASDAGQPPQVSSVPVEIAFVDGTHSLPEFSQHAYYISIHEDSPLNTTVVHVRLKSSGQEAVNYTLISSAHFTGKAAFPFSINTDGRIMVNSGLDAETQTEYAFAVAATLKSAPAYVSHAEVRVKIIDENDNAPRFVGKKFVVQTPENQTTTGVVRLLPLQAIDSDQGVNGEIHYELMGGAPVDSPFSVDAKSGWLLLRGKLDKEGQGEYLLEIKATDSGTPALSSVCSVEVEVSDSFPCQLVMLHVVACPLLYMD